MNQIPISHEPFQSEPAKAPVFVRHADTTPGTLASQPWAIRMNNIGKQYKLGQARGVNDNFREDLMNMLGGLFGKKQTTSAAKNNMFWALENINLEINRGDTVGIIGRNGAGKSTLLKVLSRITAPTTGEMRYRGRLASLLEVGTGFHRELSGRENIFLNGSILGMRRAEIKQQLDAIIEFAGVEKFLDTPVKFYSSGMYVRLAFAVAAHLRTDILVIDEVLAVGDAEFQKKCLGKMQDVASDGRTVLFVSHNVGAVQSLCAKGIVLNHGKLLVNGLVDEAINTYISLRDQQIESVVDLSEHPKRTSPIPFFKQIKIESLNPKTNSISMGEGIRFVIHYESKSALQGLKIGITINDLVNQRLVAFSPNQQAPTLFENAPTKGVLRCTVPTMNLLAGRYSIALIAATNAGDLDKIEECANFEIMEKDVFQTGQIPSRHHGLIFFPADWDLTTGAP